VVLLKEAFGEDPKFPERCAITLAIEVNQSDLGDVIEIVDRSGEREVLMDKLRATHPVHREHLSEYDRNFWNVWTEALALCWATETAGLSGVTFTDDRGKPDLQSQDGTWIEAKTIDLSLNESKTMERMAELADQGTVPYRMSSDFTQAHPTMLKKFQDGLEDAHLKLARQQYGALVTFFSFRGVDWGTNSKASERIIAEWAHAAAQSHASRIVIVRRINWAAPFVDEG